MANPDLQIRGGPGHLDPEIEEGGKGARKIFVWPFGPQFGLKMERGGGGEGPPGAPPLDPPPYKLK